MPILKTHLKIKFFFIFHKVERCQFYQPCLSTSLQCHLPLIAAHGIAAFPTVFVGHCGALMAWLIRRPSEKLEGGYCVNSFIEQRCDPSQKASSYIKQLDIVKQA
ncbi:hypothetical protein L4C34_10735 [Vibrio profundum]|uniref:hypothetical protein n=1 Tax=Vibrio profundum TaxID=2910247 RepID=UPI003D0A9204